MRISKHFGISYEMSTRRFRGRATVERASCLKARKSAAADAFRFMKCSDKHEPLPRSDELRT